MAEGKMSLLEKIAHIQSEIPVLKKDRTASFKNVTYNYITLDQIELAVRPIFEKYRVCVFQQVTNGDDSLTVSTEVYDLDNLTDEPVTSALTLKGGAQSMSSIQSIGGAITYARRYTLCTIFRIVSDDDLDGAYETYQPQEIVAPPLQQEVMNLLATSSWHEAQKAETYKRIPSYKTEQLIRLRDQLRAAQEDRFQGGYK